jgi:hypothetical protein
MTGIGMTFIIYFITTPSSSKFRIFSYSKMVQIFPHASSSSSASIFHDNLIRYFGDFVVISD